MLPHAIDPEITPEGGLARRSLMGRIGAGAASAAAIATVAAGGLALSSTEAAAQAVTDADIFNFALNTEYLEAEFYLRAVTGSGLAASDVGGSGTLGSVTGGSAVPFKSVAIAQYAQRLAVDEQNHVRFERAVLNNIAPNTAVARPAIDFVNGFNQVALAAGLIVAGQTFNPFADDISFLLGSFLFEDVGVTAYGGAARLITNKDLLEAGAAIGLVEAYHAGSIRTLLANIGAGVAVNKISAARAAVGGGKEQGLTIPGLNFNAVPTDTQSLTFRRSFAEVLNILYVGGASSNFGFFPNKLNGTIK